MKAHDPLEIDIQAKFRAKLRYVAPAVVCVAIPNAGRRGFKAQRSAKREGISSGFPDVVCMWDGGLCFIEFKRRLGKPSANQEEWLERLNRWGFPATICRTPEDAIQFIEKSGAPMMNSNAA